MENPTSKDQKIRVLFVCLGNICRSPAAEGIMKSLVEKNQLSDSIYIDSAGIGGWHTGELPDSRMRQHGARRGYDFCSRARKFTVADFDKFDYIIVMDEDNYRDVRLLAKTPNDVRKIHRVTDFSRRYSHDCVPDPYYGGATGFELVLDLLEDAVEQLLEDIKQKHSLCKSE